MKQSLEPAWFGRYASIVGNPSELVYPVIIALPSSNDIDVPTSVLEPPMYVLYISVKSSEVNLTKAQSVLPPYVASKGFSVG